MKLARASKWSFVTSNGGGVGVGFAAAEGGSITLNDPNTKVDTKFMYGGLGVGIGRGFKVPKIGRIHLPGITGSSESFPSSGNVWISQDFAGVELSASDIAGGCTFMETSGGVAWGHSGCLLTFGMNLALLANVAFSPGLMTYALKSATGYLWFHGMNYGLQAGLGGASYVGALYAA